MKKRVKSEEVFNVLLAGFQFQWNKLKSKKKKLLWTIKRLTNLNSELLKWYALHIPSSKNTPEASVLFLYKNSKLEMFMLKKKKNANKKESTFFEQSIS